MKKIKKRAISEEQKKSLLDQFHKLWCTPGPNYLRLGQLLVCISELSGQDLFYIEDEDILILLNKYIEERGQNENLEDLYKNSPKENE